MVVVFISCLLGSMVDVSGGGCMGGALVGLASCIEELEMALTELAKAGLDSVAWASGGMVVAGVEDQGIKHEKKLP